MPHIVIQLSGSSDPVLARQAVEVVNRLTKSVLGKNPADMATKVEFISRDEWFIGGIPLSAGHSNAFNLEISVTDETSTKADKATYLREVFNAFSALMPNLHQTCYIYIIDARAAAYGYGGRTQEWRHQRAGV